MGEENATYDRKERSVSIVAKDPNNAVTSTKDAALVEGNAGTGAMDEVESII